LVGVCGEYIRLLDRDLDPMGVLIAVGIRPQHRVRLWCEQVGGALAPDRWAQLVALLEGAGRNTLPTVTAPVALAVEGIIGSGPSDGFPELPSSWVEAARSQNDPVTIPDGLFELIFA
ncbi:MAG: hypothetical protein R2731_19935, partial [Nocardioides sp.]